MCAAVRCVARECCGVSSGAGSHAEPCKRGSDECGAKRAEWRWLLCGPGEVEAVMLPVQHQQRSARDVLVQLARHGDEVVLQSQLRWVAVLRGKPGWQCS